MNSSASSNTSKFNLPSYFAKKLNLQNKNYINSGKFGSVYKTLTGVVKVSKSKKLIDLTNEYEISIIAGDNGIGPIVDKHRSGLEEYKNEFYLFIFMEKMENTLLDVVSNTNINGNTVMDIYSYISFKVGLLHKLGICHNDLHVKNIMKSKNNWYLIDYGKSSINTNKTSDCANDVNKLSSIQQMLSKKLKKKVKANELAPKALRF
jgi:serine/threonine protein kinase